jgi:Acetoacetate decarboxylase (ADC)
LHDRARPWLPRTTPCLLYPARYESSPVGPYREWLIAPVTRIGLRIGGCISHIGVDHEHSLRAGRAIWALPKQMSSFAWSEGCVSMRSDAARLRLESRPGAHSVPMPLFGSAFGTEAGRSTSFTVRGSASVSVGRGRLEMQSACLEPLQLERCRRFYWLKNLRIRIGAPRTLTPIAPYCASG